MSVVVFEERNPCVKYERHIVLPWATDKFDPRVLELLDENPCVIFYEWP